MCKLEVWDKVHPWSQLGGIKKKNSSDCDYAATASNSLKINIESKHVCVKYPCSQCEHFAPRADSLKMHVKNKHKGVRYPCFQGEFASTRASYLKFILKKYTKESDILVLSVSMWQLQQET